MLFPRSEKKHESSFGTVEIDLNRSDTDVSDVSTGPVVAGWPTGPQRISTSPVWIIADLLLLLMPIAFLGKKYD
jgi:hypothetical protein